MKGTMSSLGTGALLLICGHARAEHVTLDFHNVTVQYTERATSSEGDVYYIPHEILADAEYTFDIVPAEIAHHGLTLEQVLGYFRQSMEAPGSTMFVNTIGDYHHTIAFGAGSSLYLYSEGYDPGTGDWLVPPHPFVGPLLVSISPLYGLDISSDDAGLPGGVGFFGHGSPGLLALTSSGTAVPEPGTTSMLAMGLACLGGAAWRRRKRI